MLGSAYPKHKFEMIFALLFNRTDAKHTMMRGSRPIGTNPSCRRFTRAGRNMGCTVSRGAECKQSQQGNKFFHRLRLRQLKSSSVPVVPNVKNECK